MNNKKIKISGIMLVGIIIIVSFVYTINSQPIAIGNLNSSFFDPVDLGSYTYDIRSFASYKEFTDFLNNGSSVSLNYKYSSGLEKGLIAPTSAVRNGDLTTAITWESEDGVVDDIDYSETNIQVEGVDEPDYVKTDGNYIYVVSGSYLYIVKALPTEDAGVVSKLSVDFTITNIFINGDRLVLFGNLYQYYNGIEKKIEISEWVDEDISVSQCIPPPWYSNTNTMVKIYDIEDRQNPKLVNNIKVGGNFFNARMIGDYIYLITTQNSYDIRPIFEDDHTIIPLITINGEVKKIPLTDIQCIDIPSSSYSLTHVISINIKDDEADVVDKIFTLGNSQTMYVSKNNIYLTYQTNRYDYQVFQDVIDEVVMPLLPDKYKMDILTARNFNMGDSNKRTVIEWILDGFYKTINEDLKNEIELEIHKRTHRTMIHKISVNDGQIKYLCNGSVPGRILNQFSMDEHNGYFRVAVQIDSFWSNNDRIKQNTNVYVLDENLNLVGSVENIAPGENMHSARFMGNRAYLVTFEKIDPFFVIDLTNPFNPKILGELKIPGYSDYLHPFDENHIIGIGKDSDASIDSDLIHSENAVYYTAILGVKIALFDVTDPENPKEVSKVTIGWRGTNTLALNDHKAFLFDKEKELLVLPINLYEKTENNNYGTFTFQGVYVYRLTAEDGFEIKGRITHRDNIENEEDTRCWYWNSNYDITRSLYINDALYTISNEMIKINSLEDLNEIDSIILE